MISIQGRHLVTREAIAIRLEAIGPLLRVTRTLLGSNLFFFMLWGSNVEVRNGRQVQVRAFFLFSCFLFAWFGGVSFDPWRIDGRSLEKLLCRIQPVCFRSEPAFLSRQVFLSSHSRRWVPTLPRSNVTLNDLPADWPTQPERDS